MSEFHENGAATIGWSSGREMTLVILSIAEFRWETHWIDTRTIICPRRGCPLCKWEVPTSRVGFFAMELKHTQTYWLNLPAEPWDDAALLSSLPDLRGVVISVKKVGKSFAITALGTKAIEDDQPLPKSEHAIRLLAKLHRLPIADDHGFASLEASLFHAAARKAKALADAN